MKTNSKTIPVCCGKEMQISMHIGSFLLAKCPVCGDSVYVKAGNVERPQMIND